MSVVKMQKKFFDYAENLRCSVVNQRAIIYWLLMILLLSIVSLVYLAVHHSEIIIPYGLNEKIPVLVNRVSSAYITSVGLADAGTYFNIDSGNIDEQAALFLSRVSSASLYQVQREINKRIEYFKKNTLSQAFYPYQRYKKKGALGVVIRGKLMRWMSGKMILHQDIILDINYVSLSGHLYIKSWSYKNAYFKQ